LSNQIINSFKKGGVDIRNLKIVKKGEPGFSINFLSDDGEKSIVVYNGRNLDLSARDIPKQDIKNSKWFIFTSITPKSSLEFLEKAIEFSKKNNVKILANPSIRMVRLRRKKLINFIKNSDITIMNEEEINELARKKNTILSMKKVYKLGTKLVVVTLGSKGSVAYDGNKIYRQKGFKVKIIDSTGCGDSFTAAFLHYILKNKDIAKALEFATATGALELQMIGATNLPTEREILNFISKH
jgi:sugar/nucleoside kinase (ribokinase family)